MSLSKVWFSLFCVAFKEPTAHLWAEICSLSMVEGPLRPSAGCASLGGGSAGSPWSLTRVKAASPASKRSLDQIPCLTWSGLATPLMIGKFGTVGSITRELIFALQLLSQWLIVPFGDVVKYAVFLELWVHVYLLKNTRTKGKYLRAFWLHVPG